MRATVLPETLADILELTAEVGDRLAARAAAVDAGTEPSEPGYRELREAGLPALLVPRAAGGAGLDFAGYTRVLETLAARDAATALGFNMHNVAIGALCESADTPLPAGAEEFRHWVFTEVTEGRALFASAVSEPGTGAKLRALRTTYRADGDGYVLDGTKSFVSLSGLADYFVVAAAAREGADEVSHFVVAADDPGVRFGELWEGAAMNGTRTGGLVLDGVRLPRSRLFLGVEGMSLYKLVREPHWMVAGYTGVYLGIAQALFDHVVDFVRGSARHRDSPVVRHEVGRLSAELRAARALVYAAGELVVARRGSTEANASVHAAKYTVGELAPRLALAAVRICGASALGRARPVERLLRESSFALVMPAKPDECLEYLGKAALGVNLRDVDSLDW
ncbi:acyl-CoA/acyl-ACP dehydrogenase [Streptomyces sp. LX-29]|uniref:acyl-CoA dehydrogenase family protein n=1 Tax=Streptomyces sp. LX-29 TaxID=2900152 RepID=UPI00240D18C0|nr:acyl-CoA dehydrogenase family protein [Streptomyces sp. LX-29]WFB09338.1 acyl-CoA/acyl-ACP dehydrogenase [Streptomyces sp. LX-29]